MSTDQGASEELRMEAAAYGPQSQQPDYVRAPFPLIALPRVLRAFVTEAAGAMGVAPECVATPALGTCATAIGNTRRIRLNSAWTEPSVIWAITLMESGSLKTPAYNAAMEPLRMAQGLSEEKFRQDHADYRNAKVQFEADASLWKTSSPATSPETASGPPTEPVEPKPVDLYTSDSTVEALGTLFANNPRGLALTRDELSAFFGSFGAYKGGRGSDESSYLECYNAGAIKLNRASGKRIYVQAAALSIFGTCQPAVFMNAIGVNGKTTNQVENGMAARFLIAAPAPRPKRWLEPKPYQARPYWEMVASLLSIPLSRDAGGHIAPAIIPLLPEATARFREFVNEHGKQTAAIGNAALRYHYAKLEAVAARLALIFYLCDGATGDLGGLTGVQERHVLSGIAVARWFGREAARVYEGIEGEEDRNKRQLLEDIQKHGGTVTLNELRSARRRWRVPHAAELALQTLAREGYGTLSLIPSGPRGGGQTMLFTLYTEEGGPLTPENPGIPEVSDTLTTEYGASADEYGATADEASIGQEA